MLPNSVYQFKWQMDNLKQSKLRFINMNVVELKKSELLHSTKKNKIHTALHMNTP